MALRSLEAGSPPWPVPANLKLLWVGVAGAQPGGMQVTAVHPHNCSCCTWFSSGACLWGGLWRPAGVWDAGSLCLTEAGPGSPSHLLCTPCSRTLPTPSCAGAGRPSEFQSLPCTDSLRGAPGRVLMWLPCTRVSGGPGAALCSGLESTFLRPVAPGGSGSACRGQASGHPESKK